MAYVTGELVLFGHQALAGVALLELGLLPDDEAAVEDAALRQGQVSVVGGLILEAVEKLRSRLGFEPLVVEDGQAEVRVAPQ